jgi:Xaa-Pro aminopeptidase
MAAQLTSPDILKARRAELLRAAHAAGADGVAVFGFGSALGSGSMSHGFLRFFSGWDGHESLSLLMVGRDEARLYVGSPFLLPMARETRPDLVVEFVPALAWGEALAAFCKAEPIATVGFGEMPVQVGAALKRSGFDPVAAIDEAAALLRLVKDEAALARHRDAAALCDLLFGALGAHISRRLPTWTIQLELETLARRRGADYCRTWLTAAPAADYPRYWPDESRRTPEFGDQVLFGVALTVDGHWGHGIRMGSIGAQKPEHRELVDHVEAMLSAGVGALSPGLALTGVEAAMETVFARRVGPTYGDRVRRFRNGHGLGFSYEEPLTSAAFRQHFDPASPPSAGSIDLAPGMVFELHPNIFVAGLGGAALGEMMLVTATGPEFLLHHPRDCPCWE